MIQRAIDDLGGLYELLRLGFLTGFRLHGPYGQWRLHTAFGRGLPASRAELIRSVLAYGRWVYRLRRSA